MYPTPEEFQECLALSNRRHVASKSYELWVMKEHGEHISCIMHIKVSKSHPLYQRTRLIASGQLLAASKGRANGLIMYGLNK